VHHNNIIIHIQQDATLQHYFIWKLLYMFRVVPSPITRSAKQVYLQHLVFVTPHCYMPLWFECVVDCVRHPPHTQTSSNYSTIAALT